MLAVPLCRAALGHPLGNAHVQGLQQAVPDAVVIPPDVNKYRAVGRQVRELMLATTPLVQPLSIDEAFLDLAGSERFQGGPAARTLVLLARRIEREIGVTVSIGLSYNKFLAKIASDLDKPRGFAVLGRGEALDFLAPKPVSLIWGVGDALRQKLARDGIGTIAELRQRDERELTQRYGAIGRRLARFARGEDDRTVDPDAPTKSISVETTFARDLSRFEDLAEVLRPLAESLARRLARSGHAAAGVTVKLKTADFRALSRSRQLADPTQRADKSLDPGGATPGAGGGRRHPLPPHRHRRRPPGGTGLADRPDFFGPAGPGS